MQPNLGPDAPSWAQQMFTSLNSSNVELKKELAVLNTSNVELKNEVVALKDAHAKEVVSLKESVRQMEDTIKRTAHVCNSMTL